VQHPAIVENSKHTLLVKAVLLYQIFKNLMENNNILACLIDDDRVHAFVVERMLKKTSNCRDLLVFNDGTHALHYIKKTTDIDNIPDIIFLDINMPVMNGWNFLDEFERISDSLPKKIDIYMVSSSKNPFDMARAKTLSLVKDYIPKPITINQYYSIFKPDKHQMV
jgi:CheY-like chemotaxis protein